MLQDSSAVRKFGTFWYGGRLSALEQACAHSFIQHGYSLVLFSYEPIDNAPDGVELRDAAHLVPKELTRRFYLDGRPQITPFSNLFRYTMIRECGLVWTDLDVLMIDRLPDDLPNDIIVKEEQGGINGAILYVSSKKIADQLISRAMAVTDRNLIWGQAGPILLTEVMNEVTESIDIVDNAIFYPVEYYDIYKVLLDEFTDECKEKCRRASTLHLFNNIFSKMGYWKEIAPPVGSFLHYKIQQTGGLSFFRDVYPQSVISQITENYRMRLSGEGLGIKGVVSQLIPSIRRTWRHYHPDQNKRLLTP